MQASYVNKKEDIVMKKNNMILPIKRLFSMLAASLLVSLSLLGTTPLNAYAKEPAAEVVDSRPDYTVYVNRALNCVTVYLVNEDGSLTPVKAFTCSCGRAGHETPLGSFKTSDYYDWRLMVDNTYGRYAVRFNRHILFHSVPYLRANPSTLEWDQYNLLGTSASLGCVRMRVEDCKWIYDNCKVGTTVVVYEDYTSPGPLGKPEAQKIPESNPNRDWDPTDLNPANPWLAGSISSYETFNATVYAQKYPDVAAKLGTDKDALWEHYITYGIKEGRTDKW